MFNTCNNIIDKMNAAGKKRTPFLFGINFELTEGFFIPYPQQQQEILFNINGTGNTNTTNQTAPEFSFHTHPISLEDYKTKFDIAMEDLSTCKINLINLTIKTPITTSLSLKEIFKYSKAKYKLYIPNKLVCFSPEIFIRTEKGKIYSYPMKGTINANIPDAESIITNSQKEIDEHTTAVRLIHQDLSKFATNITTKRFRYIDTINNHKGKLLQVSSEVEGTLPHNFNENIGTHILSLLPAGSIAGNPREASLNTIRNAEEQPRGYYTGIAGIFDGEEIDCGVLIRYIEQEDNNLFFRSGGGVTINSNHLSEYKEVIEKIYLPI